MILASRMTRPYIVMRYMAGGTLRERMGGTAAAFVRDRAASWSAWLRHWIKRTSEGIIHRDLKPDNVFFDRG